MNDFTHTWDNMNLRQRIAHLLDDWKQSRNTNDPMVLRVAATMAHHQLEEADAEIEDLRFQLIGTQGELDSALSRERTLLDEQEDCRIGADNLHSEIERLREQLRLANIDNFNMTAEAERMRDELVRNADEFRETLTELRERVKTLTVERDAARQMFCNTMTDHCEEDEARQIAKEYGWDCFKEER